MNAEPWKEPVTVMRDLSPIHSHAQWVIANSLGVSRRSNVAGAKSFVGNILAVSSLKPKILVLSHA
jgi:hypothetical protein